MRFIYCSKTSYWDEDETPETEPVDEPPIILDGDDDRGDDGDDR